MQFTLPIWLIFYSSNIGFSNSQSIFLGTFAWFVSLFFEYPTGFIADKFGNKSSYIWGTLLYGFSYSLFVIPIQNFWYFFAILIIQGIGWALASGSLESYIYNYLQQESKTEIYKKITSNKYTFLFLARILGSLASLPLFLLNPRLPFLISGIFMVVAAFIAYSLPKIHKIKNANQKIRFSESLSYFQKFIILPKVLSFILIILIPLTAFADLVFTTYPKLLESIGLIQMVGYSTTTISLFSVLGSQLFKILHLKTRYYLFINLILSGFYIYASTTSNLTVIFLGLAFGGLAFGSLSSIQNTYLQPLIDGKYRTSVLSGIAFLSGIGSIVGANIGGFMFDQIGIKVTLTWTFYIYIIISILLYSFFWSQNNNLGSPSKHRIF